MTQTQGTGSTKVRSTWASGNLYFYEAAVGRTATGDVLQIGTGAVIVGGTAQNVDFKWYGTGGLSFILDVGASSMTLVGCNVAIDTDLTVTSTNPAASIEAIDAAISAGGTDNYSGTSIKAVKGNTEVSTTGAYIGNAYGGWFGLKFTAASGMERGGLATGLYAEAHTERTENAQPNAVAYFQSVVSGDGIMTNMPILVLTSTGGSNSDKSMYAIEFGHQPASTTVSTGSGGMYYNETIKVKANAADRFIPLSTVEGTYTTAYPIVNSATLGYRSTATFAPDSTYTNYVLATGWKGDTNELDITFAEATNQNLNLYQTNLNCKAASGNGPQNASQMNIMHSLITHDTDDMTFLRLKCADFNVVIGENLQDAYAYQGEILFNASGITVGGEAATLGLVMNAGSEAVTGKLRGLVISMQGAGTYATAIGLELRTTCGTGLGNGLSEGIKIFGTPLPVIGIAMGDQAGDNQGPQFAFYFPSGGSADEGPARSSAQSGDGNGSIQIKIGGDTKWLQYWNNAS